MKPLSNEKMMGQAAAAFAEYDLPDGARVSAAFGETRIGYVYIEGEGEAEMAQIVQAIQPEPYEIDSRGGHIVITKYLSTQAGTVEVCAQMTVVEERPKVSKSAKDRALEAIGVTVDA